jgi:hypothetical protein
MIYTINTPKGNDSRRGFVLSGSGAFFGELK